MPWRPIVSWDVEAPTFSWQPAHKWRWGCQPYAPDALYPQEDAWYSFLLEAESTSAAGRIRSTEKSNVLIGNRTRDLLACSTVQATKYSRYDLIRCSCVSSRLHFFSIDGISGRRTLCSGLYIAIFTCAGISEFGFCITGFTMWGHISNNRFRLRQFFFFLFLIIAKSTWQVSVNLKM
jgi:hypothetical protein